VGGPGDRAARSLAMEESGPGRRQGDMSDDEREPDEAEPEEPAEDDGDDGDDVEAHVRPQPPPRSMNGL
jgi:hypothetical protein